MNAADWLRIVAVVLTAMCMGGLAEPIVVASLRTKRVWLLVFVIEGFMFSCAMATIAHFGDSDVAWYRTPLVIVVGVVGVIYLLIYHRDVKRGEVLAREVHDALHHSDDPSRR